MHIPNGPKRAAALVCDLDGVVRHYDGAAQAVVEARYGLSEGAIGRACFLSPLLTEAISGRVRDQEWREAASRDLAVLIGSRAADAVREWSDLPVVLARDVLDLLAAVRLRHPVILLTNATDRLPDDLERLGIAEAFDRIVNTSDVGAPKPDVRAFEAAATAAEQLLGGAIQPDALALVDDTEANVVAAEALGWGGHIYRDAESLNRFLLACGLLH